MNNNFNVHFVYLWSSVVDRFHDKLCNCCIYSISWCVYRKWDNNVPNIYAVFNKQCGGPGSIPELGRFPWRRAWQLAPVFLPGESPGTEEPGGGYSPWGHKESDTTERLSTDSSKQQRLPTPPPPAQRKYQQMSTWNMLSLLHWLGRASLLLGFQTACLQTCTHGWQQPVLLQFSDLCVHADTIYINRGSATCILKWVCACCSLRGSQKSPPSCIFHSR